MSSSKAGDLKKCLVIGPIGSIDSATRRRSDQVLKHIIKPVAEEGGYVAERADENSKPGIVTTQIIEDLLSVPLVIADLTELNANVFYELAIRHATRKAVVQLIREGDTIPFDVGQVRTIQVNHNDLDSVDNAKKRLAAQIRAVEQDPTLVDSPVATTIDLQSVRSTGNPTERLLASVMRAVQDVRAQVAALHHPAYFSGFGLSGFTPVVGDVGNPMRTELSTGLAGSVSARGIAQEAGILTGPFHVYRIDRPTNIVESWTREEPEDESTGKSAPNTEKNPATTGSGKKRDKE